MSDRDTHEGSECGNRCWPGGCDEHGDARGADELRCECGCLLARLVEEGVELKCRRCRRIFTIPLTRGAWTRPALARTTNPSVRPAWPREKWQHPGRHKPANPRTT